MEPLERVAAETYGSCGGTGVTYRGRKPRVTQQTATAGTPKERVKFKRREADTGRCESCNGLHSDCGEA